MNDKLSDVVAHFFDFGATADLLSRDFVQQALLASALLAVGAGGLGLLVRGGRAAR